MLYVIEIETDEKFEEIKCTKDTQCIKEKCPLFTNAGDSFIDSCTLDWANAKSINIRKV